MRLNKSKKIALGIGVLLFFALVAFSFSYSIAHQPQTTGVSVDIKGVALLNIDSAPGITVSPQAIWGVMLDYSALAAIR